LIEAVVSLDALTRACGVNRDELLRYATAHPRWRGVRLVPEVVRLVDLGAESPMESRLRLILVLGGLPAPTSQYEIRDRIGNFVARVDLAYPSLRIAIEYDGEHHRERWAQDIVRQNQIIGLGWTILRYTSRDVYRRQALVLTEVTAARSSALAA
jgi:very-short-patch-repair endonuclease